MMKLIIGLLFVSTLSFADVSLLGSEHVKRGVKLSLWYDGVNLENNNDKNVSNGNQEVALTEEVLIPLENLDL